MNVELLLEWMTHLGSGPWGAFREGVASLIEDEGALDNRELVRSLRAALSDLGHVDFFVAGGRRWCVRRPALVGLAQPEHHILVGGRTPALMKQVCETLALRADVTVAEVIPGLARVEIVGEQSELAAAAAGLGVEYVPDAAARLAAKLTSVRRVLGSANHAPEPVNWSVRSWSFSDERWLDGSLERTVREYSNRHGVRRWLVDAGKDGLREVEKRAATYCAALVRGARIVQYSHESANLLVPRWAPLPDSFARVACLATGKLGAPCKDGTLFGELSPRIAAMLLVTLGQGYPIPKGKR